MDSFFLGSMISMSSTTIIIKAFDDLNIKKQRFTDLVFGVLVVEDLVGILLLVLLPTIALGSTIDGEALLFSTGKLVLFLVLCFVAGIYLVPTMLKKIDSFLNDEQFITIHAAERAKEHRASDSCRCMNGPHVPAPTASARVRHGSVLDERQSPRRLDRELRGTAVWTSARQPTEELSD